jgi:hypothetical protein
MSYDLESPPVASQTPYRAISLWAVLSVICAAGTLSMVVFDWKMAFFPVAAVFCGRRALLQMQRFPDEYTGKRLAEIGLLSGTALGLGFSIWLLLGGHEVPHGYRVLEYSELEPTSSDRDQISATAQELSDKATHVYLRGYMLPPMGGRVMGLSKFSICRNSDMCKFATTFGMKSARPTEEIHIEMTGDRTVNYTSRQIGIGGIFCVDRDRGPGYYLIKADYIYE